jgi:beta-glucosidase
MSMQHSKTQQPVSPEVETKIDALLAQMTLEEKVGQMAQAEKNSITPAEVTAYSIGSVLSGGGGNPEPNTPENWHGLVSGYLQAARESRLGIPLIYGVDAVHGHNNVVNAVIFPHNIGLGATRDPEIVEKIGHATAKEILATAAQWNFAPAVSVPQDIRWGRTYEGYSEDTALVTEMALAYLKGLQAPTESGEWVLPSVKHFVGDGGTDWGSSKPMEWASGDNWQGPTDVFKIDQGDMTVDEETVRQVHLAPYVAAVESGVLNIMVSFSSWNGTKMHAHRYLLTDVLKGEYGFEGFLVSDWMAINQIHEDFYTCVVESINAGLDMIMVPFDFKQFIEATLSAVQKGDIPQERIDDAVRRILRAKFALGLFEQAELPAYQEGVLGAEAHRQIAAEAVKKSLVLLKNEGNALPLQADAPVLVAGEAADDIGLACGGWTISWQGGSGPITQGTSLLSGLKAIGGDAVIYQANGEFGEKSTTGVVVVAENPYAEGMGDNGSLSLTDDQRALIQRTREHVDKLVLVVYSGRPIIISDVVDLCDAIVAAWLPGSEAAAIAEVLYGQQAFTGKLSFSWPRSIEQIPLSALKASETPPQWAFGHGL